MRDSDRIEIALQMTMAMADVNRQANAERWVRGWAALSERMETEAICAACNRAIKTQADSKEDAKLVRVALRRSQGIAKRLGLVEEFMRSPYSRELALSRLEGFSGDPLGTNPDNPTAPIETDSAILDRAVLTARMKADPDPMIVEREFRRIRSEFEILQRLV